MHSYLRLTYADGCNVHEGGWQLTKSIEPSRHVDVSLRLHRMLSSAQLDCQCRTKLDEALDRFSVLENRRQLRHGLKEARHRRNLIVDQLSYLADIDEITEDETDFTVFQEMALLFDEIVNQAGKAADVLRKIETLAIPAAKRKSV